MTEVFAASADAGAHFQSDAVSMILGAGPMVQFVLLLLLVFSVVSWAVILMKFKLVRQAERENEQFIESYMKGTSLSQIAPEANKFRNSTIAEVFRAGYDELEKNAKKKGGPRGAEGSYEIRGIDSIERALNRASGSEQTRIETALGFLATTGSACPFIGLFGTVWGIMDAFRGIGARGTATLAVVAPGISEALIATAAGLAAAIPAVVFYNYFQNRIRKVMLETDNFSSELLNIIERFYVNK
ncbi:MAG: protein TolQ [Syntrophales bacterium]|nr:protein TolQ [Syntrophales bacterium]HPL63178.1 protein TolQ [Syntrophales bacterium]